MYIYGTQIQDLKVAKCAYNTSSYTKLVQNAKYLWNFFHRRRRRRRLTHS